MICPNCGAEYGGPYAHAYLGQCFQELQRRIGQLEARQLELQRDNECLERIATTLARMAARNRRGSRLASELAAGFAFLRREQGSLHIARLVGAPGS